MWVGGVQRYMEQLYKSRCFFYTVALFCLLGCFVHTVMSCIYAHGYLGRAQRYVELL